MTELAEFEAFHLKANEHVKNALAEAFDMLDWDGIAKPLYDHFVAEARRLCEDKANVMPWVLRPDGTLGELNITAYVPLGDDDAIEVQDVPLSDIIFNEIADDPVYYLEAAKRSIAIAEERLIQWKLDNPQRAGK